LGYYLGVGDFKFTNSWCCLLKFLKDGLPLLIAIDGCSFGGTFDSFTPWQLIYFPCTADLQSGLAGNSLALCGSFTMVGFIGESP
jgi:hypothetical protein